MRHANVISALAVFTFSATSPFTQDARAQQMATAGEPTAIAPNALLPAAAAAGARTPSREVVVATGENFRLRIPKGSRLRGKGEPVIGELTQPVYVGNELIVACGARISGHVSAVQSEPRSSRVKRLFNGDLTPPKTAVVTFDTITLGDGVIVPFRAQAAIGEAGVKKAEYVDKKDRPSIKTQIKTQVGEAIHSPNKLQRFSEAVVTSLPYHPEYIDQGTVFNATLVAPLAITMTEPATMMTLTPEANKFLHVRLLTAVNSGAKASEGAAANRTVTAELTQPFYGADGTLLYPAGLQLQGAVTHEAAAGWLKKQGAMSFAFTSITLADGSTHPLKAPVAAVEAADAQRLHVSVEGDMKATTNRLQQLMAPVKFIGPARDTQDLSHAKTAWTRAGNGREGLGFLGAGAAQASAMTSVGFAYFGAAKSAFTAFVAKGEEVSLPVNTPILLRMEN